MKHVFYFCMCCLFFIGGGQRHCLSAEQFDEGTDFSLNIGQDGNVSPYVAFPVFWNERFFSYLGASSLSVNDVTTLSDFPDSKISYNYQESSFIFAPVGLWYNADVFSFYTRLTYEYTKGKKNEFGYARMAKDEVPIAADYGVKTELHNFYLTLGIKYISEFFYADISGDISPAYVVSMEQSLSVPALLKDDKSSTGTHTGLLNYNFCAEAGVKFSSYIALGLRYRYDFIPYRYDQLALDGEIPVEQDELKETISILLFSPAIHLGGLYPYLGYQTMTLVNEDKIARETSIYKENRLVVGMAYTF